MSTEYRIKLPYARPPVSLTLNGRPHWSTKARDTRDVRHSVTVLVKQAKIPQQDHITAWIEWAPGDRRKRDVDNIIPFSKVIFDAIARGPRKELVGCDIVPDDSPEYFTKLMPRILGPAESAEVGMWLVVTTGGAP